MGVILRLAPGRLKFVRLVRLITAFVAAVQVSHLRAQHRGELSLVPVSRIGVALGSPELEFTMIPTIAFLPGNRIAIADAVTRNVRVFTVAGEHMVTLGREGAGPGEFFLPAAMAVDSMLRVFDLQQQREVVFDLEGQHVQTRRLPTVPGHAAALAWRLENDDVVVLTAASFVFGAGTSQPDQFVLHVGVAASTPSEDFVPAPSCGMTPGHHAGGL